MHDANTPCCAKRVSVAEWATGGNRDYGGDGGDVQDEQCVSHGGLSENAWRSFPVVPKLAPNASKRSDIGALSKNGERGRDKARAKKQYACYRAYYPKKIFPVVKSLKRSEE